MRSNTEGVAPSHAWPKAEELEPEDIDSSTDFQGMPWFFADSFFRNVPVSVQLIFLLGARNGMSPTSD